MYPCGVVPRNQSGCGSVNGLPGAAETYRLCVVFPSLGLGNLGWLVLVTGWSRVIAICSSPRERFLPLRPSRQTAENAQRFLHQMYTKGTDGVSKVDQSKCADKPAGAILLAVAVSTCSHSFGPTFELVASRWFRRMTKKSLGEGFMKDLLTATVLLAGLSGCTLLRSEVEV